MNPQRRQRWATVLVAALAAIAVAGAGAQLTDVGPWYAQLRQPPWKPSDWLFGPVWTAIFALTAAAGVLAWEAALGRGARRWLVGAFALNGLLNMSWSLLFFRLRRPDWALIEVAFLWLSIVLLIVLCAAQSRRAGWLLLPYLAWVTFAAVLNFAVVRLNGPFGRP
jgi:tryptophan-rich sensory protein